MFHQTQHFPDLYPTSQLLQVFHTNGHFLRHLGDGCHADQRSSEGLEHERLRLRGKPRTFDDDDGTSIVHATALFLRHVDQNLPSRQQHSILIPQSVDITVVKKGKNRAITFQTTSNSLTFPVQWV